jgi:hypothetical protein
MKDYRGIRRDIERLKALRPGPRTDPGRVSRLLMDLFARGHTGEPADLSHLSPDDAELVREAIARSEADRLRCNEESEAGKFVRRELDRLGLAQPPYGMAELDDQPGGLIEEAIRLVEIPTPNPLPPSD